MNPQSFFLENGGSDLLKALDLPVNKGFQALFGTRRPSWKSGSTSVPAFASSKATLVVTPGRLSLYSLTTSNEAVPSNVMMSTPLKTKDFDDLVINALDMPRPLLFLTVGSGYISDLRSARLTIDPGVVEVSGDMNFLLDSFRIDRILTIAKEMQTRVKTLRGVARLLDMAQNASDVSLAAIRTREKIQRILGTKEFKKLSEEEAEAKLDDFWRRIADLPLPADLAWSAAEKKEEN